MNDCKMCEGNGHFYDLEGQIWRCYCRTSDNERLEEIKGRRKSYRPDVLPIWFEDMDWLINRVEELERRIEKEYQYAKQKLSPKIIKLEQQNKRYREALGFYADDLTYTDRQYTSTGQLVSTGYFNIMSDNGEKARKALEE